MGLMAINSIQKVLRKRRHPEKKLFKKINRIVRSQVVTVYPIKKNSAKDNNNGDK
jgi:hypothetical protein